MQPPYIPPREADLVSWAGNFNTLITATPAQYGLSPADAVSIDSVVTPFLTAFTLAVNPSTRTGPNVAAKDAARNAMLAILRQYAINIRNNAGVSNDDKLALGLNIPDTSKSPIPAPSTNPILAIIAATPGNHTLRFSDSNTPDKRSKPFGAVALEVWRTIADAPVGAPTAATFMAMVTRQPFVSEFDASQNGKTCSYFGRWITRTGLRGPWSPAVSMTIAA